MALNTKHINTIFGVIIILCFTPIISPAIALLMGFLISMCGIKHKQLTQYTSILLQVSIVLMGFAMNLHQVIQTSKAGFYETAFSVTFVMVCGLILGRLLRVDSQIALLISAGTAICGGSAIAAIVPVIKAKHHQTTMSLVVVFMLNAVALVLFPYIGHVLQLSQETFGNWAAIAIHDTSSVVGAGASYGPKALEIATTIKLIRALWIIPLSILIAVFQPNKSHGKLKFPWFIGLFIISMIVSNALPQWSQTYAHLQWLGKHIMIVVLFLIGSNISIAELKQAGLRSFIMALLLWGIIATTSLIILSKI
ncbi:putative sulfate exporter family transporter [Puteibacter caeruleilacunae]|nr:putative sulfate exporter family transporter [Puteibacter caeruleilacunae]